MVPRTYVIEDFIREEIVQVCYEKKKKKKAINYVTGKGYNN